MVSMRSYLVLTLLCTAAVSTSGTEIKFTPNNENGDNDQGNGSNGDAGPLPLSQNQRNQLLQLEQAIAQSPDPQATLQQVAQSNNMDPQDLLSMLERNRQDLQQAGAAGVGTGATLPTWPKTLIKLITSVGVVLSQAASKNPRAFSIATVSMLLMLYMLITAPRTGIVLSSRNGLFSKGHTTLFVPPTKYINRYIESPRLTRATVSIPQPVIASLADLPKTLIEPSADDGVVYHKRNKETKQVAQAVTSQHTIPLQDLTPEELDDDDDFHQELSVLLLETATSVLLDRRFSEFVEGNLRVQSSSAEQQRRSILVLPRTGDWGRYGVQPLKVAKQSEDDTQLNLLYNTLKGGVFDGQLQFMVQQRKSGDVVVRVNLLIPKRGRKLPKKSATALVSSLSESIARSVRTGTNQKLTRQMQSARYKSKAKSRASERRTFRFEKEKELEEMAKDRRRRLQRQNPNSGSYRPSNRRQQSPNNC